MEWVGTSQLTAKWAKDAAKAELISECFPLDLCTNTAHGLQHPELMWQCTQLQGVPVVYWDTQRTSPCFAGYSHSWCSGSKPQHWERMMMVTRNAKGRETVSLAAKSASPQLGSQGHGRVQLCAAKGDLFHPAAGVLEAGSEGNCSTHSVLRSL